MSIKDLASKTQGVAARKVEKASADRGPRTAPVMMYDLTSRMHDAEAKVEQLNKELDEAKRFGERRELPLADLHEVPGRRRRLNAEQYADLKENVRHNGILEPIKVRPRASGGWEIIAGHNKTAISRELGKEVVLCSIEDTDDIETELIAFFTNLFQTPLPPYEVYLGFKLLQRQEAVATQKDLVIRSGKTKSEVSKYMSFDLFPKEAHKILTSHPDLIGYNAASTFAKHIKAGRVDVVMALIKQLLAGKMDQAQASEALESSGSALDGIALDEAGNLRSLSSGDGQQAKRSKGGVAIAAGAKPYCNLIRSEKTMRIKFSSEAEARLMEQEFKDFLQGRADKVAAEINANSGS